MGRNRYRRSAGRTRRDETAALMSAVVTGGAKRITSLGLLLGLVGLCAFGWTVVSESAYFNVRHFEVEASAHLSRAEILSLAGLDAPVNLLTFDADAAAEHLEAHPWVARAVVIKSLPHTAKIEVQERSAAGLVVFEAQYLVDEEGEIFARVEVGEAPAVPMITGISRAQYEAEPVRSRQRIVEGLAIARLYGRAQMAQRRPLSDVSVGEGGRIELIVGRTRVSLGRGPQRKQLDRLAQVFGELARRDADAEYVLLADDARRAIVKETVVRRGSRG